MKVNWKTWMKLRLDRRISVAETSLVDLSSNTDCLSCKGVPDLGEEGARHMAKTTG